MPSVHRIKFGLPTGSLQNTTLEILQKAGYNISVSERSYLPVIDDEEIKCMFFRAQEIAKYVEGGIVDVGITGKDWVIETKADVVEITELFYSKQKYVPCKLVLAVPKNSKIKSVKDLAGKKISTEHINITEDYLRKNKIKAEVEFSWGATEIKAPGIVDAIVEITDTGQSLEINNLKIIDVIMELSVKIIANKKSYKDRWKKEKINNLALILKGVLIAEGKVGLKMNIKVADLKKIIYQIPALRKPTISPINEKGWVAVEIITDKKQAREIIPKLKKAGAEGIVEYHLNTVVL